MSTAVVGTAINASPRVRIRPPPRHLSTNPNARNLKQLGDLFTPPFPMDFLPDDIIVTTTTTSSPGWPPSTTNLLYSRKYRFYIEFANAIAGVGILSNHDHLFVQFANRYYFPS
mmetsp:Transcript_31698/g.58572  ORF Transcript_31698/g.58572 Transcript_31698/m.58572 type:complete len:114 (-) Transcript_31698:554-895(-)